VGYLNGEYDYDRGEYRVPASAAHAWVEVYFAGYGWIEFEPTPAFPAPVYLSSGGQAGGSPAAPREERAAVAWGQIAAGLGVVLGAAILILLAAWLWRLARESRRVSRPAARLYWRLRFILAWGGLAAPGSATPLEFSALCRAELGGRPRLMAAVDHLTALYLRERFAPAAVEARQQAAAAAQWRSVRGEIFYWVIRRRFTTETRRARRRVFVGEKD